MSAGLLERLTRLGVHLAREGDRLAVDGPSNVLTDALLAEVADHKAGLLAALDAPRAATEPAPAGTGSVGCPAPPVGGVDGLGALGEPAPWRCFACRRGSPVEHGPGWWRCSACGVQIGRPSTRPPRLVMRWRDGDPSKVAAPAGGPAVTVRWSADLRGWLAIYNRSTGELVEIPYAEAPDAWKAAVRRAR